MPKLLIVARHPQSEWNVIKNASLSPGAAKPLLLPGCTDTDLTPLGKIQACLLGEDLHRRFGHINHFFHSLLERTRTATWIMQRHTRLCDPRRTCLFGEESFFDELREGRGLAQRAKRIAAAIVESHPGDAVWEEASEIFGQYLYFVVVLYAGTETDKDKFFSPYSVEAFMHFTENFADYQERIFQWLLTGEIGPETRHCLDLLREHALAQMAKYTPLSRYPVIAIPLQDDHELAAIVFEGIHFCRSERFNPWGSIETFLKQGLFEHSRWQWPRAEDVVLVMTHAKRIIRIRQVLEGLAEDEVQRLLRADGTGFPQNASYTVYASEGGRWIRRGEPYMLPDGIKSLGGRELGLALKPQALSGICRRLKLSYADVARFRVA